MRELNNCISSISKNIIFLSKKTHNIKLLIRSISKHYTSEEWLTYIFNEIKYDNWLWRYSDMVMLLKYQ